MAQPALEVAEIFRDHGAAWREANRGRVSLGQLKVMSAIESCRTAALGGYVARCENAACAHTVIAYCSCLTGKLGNGEFQGRFGIFLWVRRDFKALSLSIITCPPARSCAVSR
jgi:hypothetical protein